MGIFVLLLLFPLLTPLVQTAENPGPVTELSDVKCTFITPVKDVYTVIRLTVPSRRANSVVEEQLTDSQL